MRGKSLIFFLLLSKNFFFIKDIFLDKSTLCTRVSLLNLIKRYHFLVRTMDRHLCEKLNIVDWHAPLRVRGQLKNDGERGERTHRITEERKFKI